MNKSKVLLRFFLDEEGAVIAQMDITNTPGIIPMRNSEVILEGIVNEDVDENDIFDYYTVKKVCYSYGDDLVLIDVFVRGGFWEVEDVRY